MSAASQKRRALRRAKERTAQIGRGSKAPEPWPERIAAPPNRVNVYTCPACGAETVTIDLHRGVTPAFLHRPWANHEPSCMPAGTFDTYSRSNWYQPPPGHGAPTLEWYAPTREEARKAGPAMFEHAQRGGLFIRRRG